MPHEIVLTDRARQTLAELGERDQVRHRKVLKALALMESNIRHQGLHTHEYHAEKGPNDEKVFLAYVENQTSAAYRIFWYYGPEKQQITVYAITPHP